MLDDHVLTCKKHTGAIAGHDHVMNVTAQLARKSGLKVRVNRKVDTTAADNNKPNLATSLINPTLFIIFSDNGGGTNIEEVATISLHKNPTLKTHLHFSLVIVDGAPTTMTRGQGLNSRFSTMVRHRGRLGTVIQTVFSFGFFLFFFLEFMGMCPCGLIPPLL